MNIFSSWIQESSDQFISKIEELTWIRSFLPKMHDFSAKIEIEGRVFWGRGHSNSKDVALEIAIAEALERAFSAKNFQTTNGIAVHTAPELAKINARNELIERDLFLSHFHTNHPFRLLGDGEALIPANIKEAIKANGDQINLFKMKPSNMGTGLICLISNAQTWGGIIGLSFGDDDMNSLSIKAIMESFRQYWHLRSNQLLNSNYSEMEFDSLTSWTFEDHGKLALDPVYFQKILHLFPKISDPIYQPSQFNYLEDEFNYEIFSLESLFSCPLKAVRCVSNVSQILTLGPTQSLNKVGLERFCGNFPATINSLPHPLS